MPSALSRPFWSLKPPNPPTLWQKRRAVVTPEEASPHSRREHVLANCIAPRRKHTCKSPSIQVNTATRQAKLIAPEQTSHSHTQYQMPDDTAGCMRRPCPLASNGKTEENREHAGSTKNMVHSNERTLLLTRLMIGERCHAHHAFIDSRAPSVKGSTTQSAALSLLSLKCWGAHILARAFIGASFSSSFQLANHTAMPRDPTPYMPEKNTVKAQVPKSSRTNSTNLRTNLRARIHTSTSANGIHKRQ